MNPNKLSYIDVLKSASSFLNPGLPIRPRIPKAPRTRLSEEAKQKLRAAIHDQKPQDTTDPTSVTSTACSEKKRGRPSKSSSKTPSVDAKNHTSQSMVTNCF